MIKNFFINKQNSTKYMISNKTKAFRPTYWNTLFKKLEKYLNNNISLSKYTKVIEKDNIDIDIPKPNMDNIIFKGYYIYFEENFDKIYNLINFDEFKRNILNKYKEINFNDGISLHIR